MESATGALTKDVNHIIDTSTERSCQPHSPADTTPDSTNVDSSTTVIDAFIEQFLAPANHGVESQTSITFPPNVLTHTFIVEEQEVEFHNSVVHYKVGGSGYATPASERCKSAPPSLYNIPSPSSPCNEDEGDAEDSIMKMDVPPFPFSGQRKAMGTQIDAETDIVSEVVKELPHHSDPDSSRVLAPRRARSDDDVESEGGLMQRRPSNEIVDNVLDALSVRPPGEPCDEKPQLSDSPLRFQVALHNKEPTESLGLKVAADSCYLHVTEVNAGLVQEWNNVHWDMILPGDRITDVNGFCAEVGRSDELRDQLARESVLHIGVVRVFETIPLQTCTYQIEACRYYARGCRHGDACFYSHLFRNELEDIKKEHSRLRLPDVELEKRTLGDSLADSRNSNKNEYNLEAQVADASCSATLSSLPSVVG